MDVARGHEAYVAAEERSWAPRATEVPRSVPPSFHDRGVFTHTATNFGRREAEPAAVEEIDVEPQLPPTPRWMLMMGGAAIAALMGALLGGFMHI
jgi:hypothetical protein